MTGLKWLAKGEDDLSLIAAALQDSILRVADISYAKESRSLSLRLWRYRNESRDAERVLTGLRLDDVMTVQARAIDRSDPEALLVLLNIHFTPDETPPGGLMVLQFAGGGELRLSVEAIEAICVDVSDPQPTDKVPLHPDVA